MPNPVYLPPGVDPTQIERPLPQSGCFRWIWLILLLVGGCGGFSLATGLFAHPSQAAAPTPSSTHTATITPSPTPKPADPFGISRTDNRPTPTAAPLITATISAPMPTPCWYWHKVRSGETLNALAAHFGVSVATIRSWNAIPNPDHIVAGFYIRIQTGCAPTPTATLQDIPQSTAKDIHVQSYF